MPRKKIASGRYRTKRGDTLVRSIERQYKVDLKVRSDMKLSTYLSKKGASSLGKALEKSQRRSK